MHAEFEATPCGTRPKRRLLTACGFHGRIEQVDGGLSATRIEPVNKGRKPDQTAEFGDFQTPEVLARQVVGLVRKTGFLPATIIEPSCGTGAFLAAAADAYAQADLFGLDVNPAYCTAARSLFAGCERLTLVADSFFRFDWPSLLDQVRKPVLVVGNPPWVTNADLGALGSNNLPAKSNHGRLKGLDALTGKSNFDISECMLLRMVDWLRKAGGALAVLCKLAVARKVLAACWTAGVKLAQAQIHHIDASAHFGATVEACLLFLRIDGTEGGTECAVFSSLDAVMPEQRIGHADGWLIADTEAYRTWRQLRAGPARESGRTLWRSGIKHDCAAVMELKPMRGGFINGMGQTVDLEDTYLYPLAKSSDIAGTRLDWPQRRLLVTQRAIGADTRPIRDTAPRTWAYLQKHRDLLSARSSAVYRGKSDFSIFGVGDYSFAPWKIAISGLYKRLAFRLCPPYSGKPVMVDDTVNFLPFDTELEARAVLSLLDSEPARRFLHSMIFWDQKRPITIDLLRRLDIDAVRTLLERPPSTMPASQGRLLTSAPLHIPQMGLCPAHGSGIAIPDAATGSRDRWDKARRQSLPLVARARRVSLPQKQTEDPSCR